MSRNENARLAPGDSENQTSTRLHHLRALVKTASVGPGPIARSVKVAAHQFEYVGDWLDLVLDEHQDASVALVAWLRADEASERLRLWNLRGCAETELRRLREATSRAENVVTALEEVEYERQVLRRLGDGRE